MENNRESFIFYRSFRDAIDKCPTDCQLTIYRAIVDYALDGTEPHLEGVLDLVWTLVRPQLDANWKRFRNGCKGGEYGSFGGAPTGNQNARKKITTPKQPQNNPKTTHNVNVNYNNNIKEENIKEEKNSLSPGDAKLMEWITAYYPHVSQMEQGITSEQYQRLVDKHGEEAVKTKLLAMENSKTLLKKNRSIYFTLCNWLNREKQ